MGTSPPPGPAGPAGPACARREDKPGGTPPAGGPAHVRDHRGDRAGARPLAGREHDRSLPPPGAGGGGGRLRPHHPGPAPGGICHRPRGRAHRGMRGGSRGGGRAADLPAGHVPGHPRPPYRARRGPPSAAPADSGRISAKHIDPLPAGPGQDHPPAGPDPLHLNGRGDRAPAGGGGRRAGRAGSRGPAALSGAPDRRAGKRPQGDGPADAPPGDGPPGPGGGRDHRPGGPPGHGGGRGLRGGPAGHRPRAGPG